MPFALLGAVCLFTGVLLGVGARDWVASYILSRGAGRSAISAVSMGMGSGELEDGCAIAAIFYNPREDKARAVKVLLDGEEFLTFRYHPTMQSMYSSRTQSRGGEFVGYFPVPSGTHTLSASSTSDRPPRSVDMDSKDMPAVGPPAPAVELQAGHTVWVDVVEGQDNRRVIVSARPLVER